MSLLILGLAWAAPAIVDPVTDAADVLEPVQEQRLDRRIRALRDATGVQAAVLTVRTTGDLSIEDYSIGVAEAWKGGGPRDDGLLVVLAVSDRRSRIEVGYGLEGYITDTEAARLLAGAVPDLRERRYAGALEGILDGLASELDGLTPDMSIPIERRVLGWLDRLVPSGSVGTWLYGCVPLSIFALLGLINSAGWPRVRQVGVWATAAAGLAVCIAIVGLFGLSAVWAPLGGLVCGGFTMFPMVYAKAPKHAAWGVALGLAAWMVALGLVLSEDDGLVLALLLPILSATGALVVFFGAWAWWDVPEGFVPGKYSGGGSSGVGPGATDAGSGTHGSSGTGSGASGSGPDGGDWGGGGGGFGGGGASGSW